MLTGCDGYTYLREECKMTHYFCSKFSYGQSAWSKKLNTK